jgi:hypothetical protein
MYIYTCVCVCVCVSRKSSVVEFCLWTSRRGIQVRSLAGSKDITSFHSIRIGHWLQSHSHLLQRRVLSHRQGGRCHILYAIYVMYYVCKTAGISSLISTTFLVRFMRLELKLVYLFRFGTGVCSTESILINTNRTPL